MLALSCVAASAAPADASGQHPIHELANDQVSIPRWCPAVCQASQDERLQNAAPTLRWASGAIKSTTPHCNTCSTPYLFIVSVGGRTGSTTVLDMMNAHPLVRLAGENKEIGNALAMYTASNNPEIQADSGAEQRGNIQPVDLLCSLQDYFNTTTTPVESFDNKSIRGYKDIAWTTERLEFLDFLFPCNRKVINWRTNMTADALSRQAAFSGDVSKTLTKTAKAELKSNEELLKYVLSTVNAQRQRGESWRSYLLPLRDSGFETSQFNGLLEWLGETGCNFDGVIHANKHQSGGYSTAGSTVSDAKKLLRGECTLKEVRVT